MYMIKRGTTQSDKNLITLCFNMRKTHHVSLMRYVFDERYANQCKKQMHSVPQNGVADCSNIIRQLSSTLEANS